jgi:hypothetical protein
MANALSDKLPLDENGEKFQADYEIDGNGNVSLKLAKNVLDKLPENIKRKVQSQAVTFNVNDKTVR